MDHEMSIELAYDELKATFASFGLKLVKEEVKRPATYTAATDSMLQQQYYCVFFVCVKERSVDVKAEFEQQQQRSKGKTAGSGSSSSSSSNSSNSGASNGMVDTEMKEAKAHSAPSSGSRYVCDCIASHVVVCVHSRFAVVWKRCFASGFRFKFERVNRCCRFISGCNCGDSADRGQRRIERDCWQCDFIRCSWRDTSSGRQRYSAAASREEASASQVIARVCVRVCVTVTCARRDFAPRDFVNVRRRVVVFHSTLASIAFSTMCSACHTASTMGREND